MSIEIRTASNRFRGYLVFKDGKPLNSGKPIRTLREALTFAGQHGASGGWTKSYVDEGFGRRTVYVATETVNA